MGLQETDVLMLEKVCGVHLVFGKQADSSNIHILVVHYYE